MDHLDPSRIALAAAAMCVGGFVQSAVGFAFALFATPLLLWTGLPLAESVAAVTTGALLQALMGTWQLRRHVQWRLVGASTAVRVSCVAVGLLVMKLLDAQSPPWVKFAVGCILLAVLALTLIGGDRPGRHPHPAWAPAAFCSSGLLAGVCGMGGPPLVMWAMAHDWPIAKVRGFLFACFSASIPLQLLLMLVFIEPRARVIGGVTFGLTLTPAVLVGSLVGLYVGRRLPRRAARLAAMAILLVIGARSMAAPLLERQPPAADQQQVKARAEHEEDQP